MPPLVRFLGTSPSICSGRCKHACAEWSLARETSTCKVDLVDGFGWMPLKMQRVRSGNPVLQIHVYKVETQCGRLELPLIGDCCSGSKSVFDTESERSTRSSPARCLFDACLGHIVCIIADVLWRKS